VEALQSFQISIPLASQLNLASSLANQMPKGKSKGVMNSGRMELQITTQFPVSSIEAVTINWSCHN
jgi:hypothetical protein